MTVDTLVREKEHAILAEGFSRPVPLHPLLRFGRIHIRKIKPGDNLSDWDRLKLALEESFGESMEHLRPDLQTAFGV